MALRLFASETASRLGLRVAPALSKSSAWQLAGFRGFATALDGLKYAKSHEWAKTEGDTATVGISDFAQAELGDVVYVELPEIGSEVTSGETFGVVESVKAASDVYAPISGEVVEVNQKLADSPGTVNADAFGDGWMMKVKLTDPSQLDALMDKAAYESHCEAAEH